MGGRVRLRPDTGSHLVDVARRPSVVRARRGSTYVTNEGSRRRTRRRRAAPRANSRAASATATACDAPRILVRDPGDRADDRGQLVGVLLEQEAERNGAHGGPVPRLADGVLAARPIASLEEGERRARAGSAGPDHGVVLPQRGDARRDRRQNRCRRCRRSPRRWRRASWVSSVYWPSAYPSDSWK